MKKQQELRDVLKRFTADKPVNVQAEVVSVDKNQQTITAALDNEGEIVITVRLNPIVDGSNNGFIVYPKIGTICTIARISKSDKFEMLKCNEVESVEVMGGDNGGLVQIVGLTDKLNKLVDEVDNLRTTYNTHIHGVDPNTGTAILPPIATATIPTEISPFNRGDYENTNFTH